MRIIDTAKAEHFEDKWLASQIYNATDVLVTQMAFKSMLPQLGPETAVTYALARALQGPALEMSMRGVLMDQKRKAEVLAELEAHITRLEAQLLRMALEGGGLTKFNWNSHKDRATLLHDVFMLPKVQKNGATTLSRAAREKLYSYLHTRPIIAHLNLLADMQEKCKKLKAEIDPDNRIRTSYNIAGTDTGRFSSSFSIYGSGGNLQNVEESLRSLFIADSGMKWVKVDARQIQSRIVGAIQWYLFNDGAYLNACEGQDLHTLVARLVWPNLGWTGDIKKDKALCDNREKPFYRHYTHRDLCKKLGHGTNFGGAPQNLSQQTGVPLELVKAFQPKYLLAFPGITRWHKWVAEQLATKGFITGITGRKRWFWDRRNDPATIRAAIAYDPQNSEAFIVNSAMFKIWRNRTADVMMQEHDGLVFQYPAEAEDEVVPKLLAELEVPVDIGHGRTFIVPYEAKVGFNRGEYNERSNPDGLREYKPGDSGRKRQA